MLNLLEMKKYVKYISLLVGISGIIFGLGFQNRLPLNILLGILILGIFGIYLVIVIQNDEKQSEINEFLYCLNKLYKKEDNIDILNNQNKEIEILKCLENKILDINNNVFALQRNILKNYEQVRQYEETNKEIEKETLEILKTNFEAQKTSKKEFIQLLNDYFSKNSQSQKNIQENIIKIGEMPEQLTLLINNLTDKLESKMKNEKEIIEDLTEKIEVQIKKLMNSLRDLIDEISDSQDNVSEHTKQLAESYNNFEQFTKNIIEQMTMMTNKDYEFLKGFLNNDGKNN